MTTDQHTSPAMARALAAIAQNDKQHLHQHEQLRRDRRMQGLEQVICDLAAPKPIDGYFGGLQVFNELASSRHFRQLRAKMLRIAREHQIMGHRMAPTFYLNRARELRRSEVPYRNLEAVDRACAAMAEPLSQKVA